MARQRTLVSGGTGYVGRFVVEDLLAAGHSVRVMGRTSPPPGFFGGDVEFVEGSLDAAAACGAAFDGVDHFVHAAFDHVAGKYRGGEGDDPEGFRQRNLEGSLTLFGAARKAGVRRCVFLSSRAVYGRRQPGTVLSEEMEPRPDTLYGEVKLAAEQALLALCDAGSFSGTSMRVTGVYGPAGPRREHKWSALFRDYVAGADMAPRIATEVHGEDVARAVRLLLSTRSEAVRGRVFNVSDIVLDRRDLLAMVRDFTGAAAPLPDRADVSGLDVMATDRLRGLGWCPGGLEKLRATVRDLCTSIMPEDAARPLDVASGQRAGDGQG